MFNGTTIWLLYIGTVILIYIILAYVAKLKISSSLFLAFLAGILIVFLVPKQVAGFSDTTSFSLLAGVSSFLLISSLVWVLIEYW